MTLQLYNTLTRATEPLEPMQDDEFRMYSCGPTVYDFAHIGNFRAYMCSDILKRYLKYKGFVIKHIMNLTDVDDKTIKGAINEGIPLKDYTERYAKAFFEDLEALNIQKADVFPKATEHIPEMVASIAKLMDKDIAYRADDGIYFSIAKFKDYGKLSNTKLTHLEANKRNKNDSYDKDNVQDFALWKFWDKDDGDVFWETELGKGRPGWHIECSAMSTKYLDQPFDIHAGGIDLIFPHHENEIAQAEGTYDHKFVEHWFHNEHLLVDGKKMSKSLGNFFTLRDLLKKGSNPLAIRYLLLATHYRQQVNFTEESLKAAEHSVARLQEFAAKLRAVSSEDKGADDLIPIITKAKTNFEEAMDNDLNISEALAAVFEFVKEVNSLLMKDKLGKNEAQEALSLLEQFDSVIGVLQEQESLPKEIQDLVDQREEARKQKDFAESDKLRDELKAKGYEVEDTKQGPLVKKL